MARWTLMLLQTDSPPSKKLPTRLHQLAHPLTHPAAAAAVATVQLPLVKSQQTLASLFSQVSVHNNTHSNSQFTKTQTQQSRDCLGYALTLPPTWYYAAAIKERYTVCLVSCPPGLRPIDYLRLQAVSHMLPFPGKTA